MVYNFIYVIAAHIRLYPKNIYSNCKLWILITGLLICLAIISMLIGAQMGDSYFFLSDSNKIFAVLVAVSSFILFVNLPIKNSGFINMIASSTFGVLLIHTASDTMRKWLWEDTLCNAKMYYSKWLYLHSILSVIGVFAVCTFIDLLRKKTLILF